MSFFSRTLMLRPAATWRDLLELTKPRVVLLMLLTSLIGMLLARSDVPPWEVVLLGNLGIGLVAGSAAVINHVVDQQIDRIMLRTRARPVATGRVRPAEALIFAFILGVSGTTLLLLQINALTAWLTVASLVGYAGVYTMLLKRTTPQNIVIGGLAGAMPPLLGWTAITGQIDAQALLLVLIIFAWTPPHFWALAICRKEEYARAGIPMLPVTHGNRYTEIHIVIYTAILLLASILPFFSGLFGWLYLSVTMMLGGRFMQLSLRLLRDDLSTTAMATFRYSIQYLMALFLVMLVDHYLPG